jgi:hypothetical protein
VGRNVKIPEGSTFKPGPSGFRANPFSKWQEFRQKWRENPEYDMYTGVFHKDYYPQEWIDMARYFDYVEQNR